MQMADERIIQVDRATVWAALQSPDVLKECVPGAQTLTGSVEDGFDATVVQKVGPVKATFKGHVTFSDIVDLTSLTLSGEGKGGAAGFAKGGAKVTLSEVEGGTRLAYEVEAKVGGKIAQLGSRLIDSFAKKMADEFFARFQDALEPASEAEEEGETKKGWFAKLRG
jgi:carbon monoxide dehydrogenase subunit G